MSEWIARARKDYNCDVCGKKIPKGTKRLVEGYRCLAYTMIDKNICLECAKTKKGGDDNGKEGYQLYEEEGQGLYQDMEIKTQAHHL